MDTKTLIERCGGARVMADRLGVTHQAIYQWAERGIPAERVLAVAALAQVRPSDVDPVLYPPGLVA